MKPVNPRTRDLAQIHAAKKQLGWSDDEYRDIMAVVTGGIRSAAELDITGRQRLIEHLRRCQGQTHAPKRTRTPLTPLQRKIWALWMQLADAGLVRDRTMRAIDAFCHRQTQVDKMQWLNPQQSDAVILALKAWLKRRQMPEEQA